MKPIEILTLIGLIIGPLLAVLVQLYFERRKEERQRQVMILDLLMAHRRNPMHQDRVAAINRIDLVFYRYQEVRNRRKILFEHMDRERGLPEAEKVSSYEKREDLFAELIGAIAKALGYAFDHSVIKSSAYLPQGQVDQDQEFKRLREALIKIMEGGSALKIRLEP